MITWYKLANLGTAKLTGSKIMIIGRIIMFRTNQMLSGSKIIVKIKMFPSIKIFPNQPKNQLK